MRINHEIRAPEIRLIDVDGTQVGIVKIDEALQRAQEKGCDLIEISPQVTPPVCKIADFSKFRYEKEKKLKEAKKKQRLSHMKEIRIRPRISNHDLEVKIRHIKEFIERKDRVKVSIILYGRENAHREIANQLLGKITQNIDEFASVEQGIKHENNRILFMVVPKK